MYNSDSILNISRTHVCNSNSSLLKLRLCISRTVFGGPLGFKFGRVDCKLFIVLVINCNRIFFYFIRKEWPYLVNRYTLNDRYLGHLIPQITQLFSSETRMKQVRSTTNKCYSLNITLTSNAFMYSEEVERNSKLHCTKLNI